jgi:hypothetical protein
MHAVGRGLITVLVASVLAGCAPTRDNQDSCIATATVLGAILGGGGVGAGVGVGTGNGAADDAAPGRLSRGV